MLRRRRRHANEEEEELKKRRVKNVKVLRTGYSRLVTRPTSY